LTGRVQQTFKLRHVLCGVMNAWPFEKLLVRSFGWLWETELVVGCGMRRQWGGGARSG
jgi:hypothetical protein